MIILDAADQQAKLDIPVAGPTLRLPDRAVGRSSPFLPDYETSQAQHNVPTRKLQHDKADRRFWRATLFALCIYILLSAAIGIPLLVTRLGRWSHPPGGHSPPEDISAASLNIKNLGQSGVFLMESQGCNVWDTQYESLSSFSATTSHTFTPQGSLSIRSNVSHEANEAVGISGNIFVDINPDSSSSTVLVSVSLSTLPLDIRQRTFICFTDNGSERGLSIYVPEHLDDQSLQIDISLLFPQNPSISSFDTLTTYLPMFTQHFGHLAHSVVFEHINIEGAAKNISCELLQASRITVKNALAGISGTFNTTDRLILDTVGGPIYADVTVVQGATRKGPSFFSLDTGNSEIYANVTMIASYLDGPMNFVGNVKNFNGPLALNVCHGTDTPPVPLDLRVQNNQAMSNVTLDSKFIGIFDLQTKLASVSVAETKESPLSDPLGAGQHRNYLYDSTASDKVRGWVGWGTRKHGWDPRTGRVEVVSSLSPIVLQLGSGST